jgi:transcriptional regulator with XRE-family HTH domain
MASGTTEEPFGARLRRRREAGGLSRTELASACTRLGRRTDRSDIIHYERDDYLPRVPTFAALARALDVSMEVLLYGEAEAARIARHRRACRHSGRPER